MSSSMPPTAETPEPQPRLAALVIGINKYAHTIITPLHGAVKDAEDVVAYIREKWGPNADITVLLDDAATRDNIISAISALAKADINHGDPILIFFAGHGTFTNAPAGWVAGQGEIQMLVPHNFVPKYPTTLSQHGIFDLTLSNLLWKIAEAKGDNITIILDSCHSGGAGRDIQSPGTTPRSFTLDSNYAIPPEVVQELFKHELRLPPELVQQLSASPLGQSRYAQAAPGFELYGSASHVLLAACSAKEPAREPLDGGGGYFTQALLKFLREHDNAKLTYDSIIMGLPPLHPDQHPQCEGKRKTRFLFQNKDIDEKSVLYPVTRTATGFLLARGQAAGISEGAEFEVYASEDVNAPVVCKAVAEKTDAFTADLKATTTDVSDKAKPVWVRPTTMGNAASLAVFIRDQSLLRAVQAHAFEQMNDPAHKYAIRFVDQEEAPHELRVEQRPDGKAIFILNDPRCIAAGLTALPNAVEPTGAHIYGILVPSAVFFFHLRRSHQDSSLSDRIPVEAFELKEGQHGPEPATANLIQNDSLKPKHDGVLKVKLDKTKYGFKISCDVRRDLYVWVFMFDMSDLSIATIYSPNAAKSGADPCIRGPDSLAIGFGAGGGAPQTFELPPGLTIDVTYLKVFITSEYVDLGGIAQASPFNGAPRKHVTAGLDKLWQTLCVAILQAA